MEGFCIWLIKNPAVVLGIEKALGFSERVIELETHTPFTLLSAYALLHDDG